MINLAASALFVLAGFFATVSILNNVCRSILAAPKGIIPPHNSTNLVTAAVLTFVGLALIHLF